VLAQHSNSDSKSKQTNTLNPPIFSHQGGFYTTSFNLTLSSSNSNDTIFYTLDGSAPTQNSAFYTSPMLIESRASDPNVYSAIPTNYVQTGLWAYVPPAGNVFKATVVKARCFSGNNTPSETVTQSYFVDNNIQGKYNMPIVSLTTDPENLFSDSTGIYVPGVNYQAGDDGTGNYFETGTLWERPAYIEYFSITGNRELAQNTNIRIHGGDTRLLPQKALRLYADTFFSYKFFSDKNIVSFKTLMLRNSGNDNISTMFRDAFMSDLLPEMGSGLEYLAYQPVVLFIDGEFWGIHNLRERIDKYYISTNCNVNANSIDYLEKHGLIKEGDDLHYFMWYNFLESADMTIPSNYNYMSTMIDVDNFKDYNIAQIYFSNIDWPSNNRDFWRPKEQGGKWRWIVFDTDFGFGLESYSNYDNNTLVFATTPNGPTSPPSWNTNYPYATMQLRKMLQNNTFRNDFVNRFADMLNTTFKSNHVVDKINDFEQQYMSVMPEHINRWSKPATYNDWLANVEHLRVFAQNRPACMRKYIMDYFNEVENLSQDITDTSTITINVSDTAMGSVKLSTIRPLSYPWSGTYFHNVAVPLKAIAKQGYKFVTWLGTGITDSEIEIDLLSDTLFTAVFEIDTTYVPHLLFINEFMASNNSSIIDDYGEYDDWIELYNPNTDTIDIGGLYITDDLSTPQKHQIQANTNATKIPPFGYLLLWADGMTTQGPLHLNFKLSGTGEAIGIYDSTLTAIDSIVFGIQSDDISFGRFPDGNSYWRSFGTPTPGASNTVMSINNKTNENFSIFPNPANGGFIYLSSEVKHIIIYNYLGQVVLSSEKTERIDLRDFQKGIYFACINNLFTLKFTIQ